MGHIIILRGVVGVTDTLGGKFGPHLFYVIVIVFLFLFLTFYGTRYHSEGGCGCCGCTGWKIEALVSSPDGGRAILSGKPSTFDQVRDDEVIDPDKKYQKLKQPS